MIVLLTGRPSHFYGRKDRAFYLPDWVCSYVEQNQVIEVVDKMMLEERIDQKRFQAFAELALTCMSENNSGKFMSLSPLLSLCLSRLINIQCLLCFI